MYLQLLCFHLCIRRQRWIWILTTCLWNLECTVCECWFPSSKKTVVFHLRGALNNPLTVYVTMWFAINCVSAFNSKFGNNDSGLQKSVETIYWRSLYSCSSHLCIRWQRKTSDTDAGKGHKCRVVHRSPVCKFRKDDSNLEWSKPLKHHCVLRFIALVLTEA